MTTRADHWDEVHARVPDTDTSWYQTSPTASLALLEQSDISSDDHIIDVGAGISRFVDHLIDLSYARISLLDISEVALAVTRTRLGDRATPVEFHVGDVLAPPPFDPVTLWHDRAVFHFLCDEPDREAYTRSLRSRLEPGGFAIIATFDADGPEMCSSLPVRRYSADSLAAEFPMMEVRGAESEVHITPNGFPQPFTYLLLQSSAPPHRG